MSETWGPWIEHDGAGGRAPQNRQIEVEYEMNGGATADLEIWNDHPSWFWRWRVERGWLGRAKCKRRICDDPSYAPIIRYRVREYRALTELRRLAENPQPVEEVA